MYTESVIGGKSLRPQSSRGGDVAASAVGRAWDKGSENHLSLHHHSYIAVYIWLYIVVQI